ncbi:enoyl-CoA hydratase/isomerase family protein [Glutamicibacter endophyticus]|uniref:enoyl-CoA hydratase/isomerase family protein n=1 Tax=Glutamicibacter endophyticus TaxID=1522174 RepID=UPI003AEFCF2D
MSLPTAGIELSIEHSVATLRLHNPRQYNALTRQMCQELIEHIARCSEDADVAVLVLTGDGEHFCAGIAIDRMDEVLFDGPDGVVNHFDAVDRALRDCPKPVIALVRGTCYGGAWQLASACDIQLACEDVRLAITPAKIGLLFPRRGLERLVNTVGQSRARYLLFSGLRLEAEQIAAWGLFTEVLPARDLDERVAKLVQQLAENSPYALRRSKQAMNLLERAEDADSSEFWQRVWAENGANPDLAEGRAAFQQKRRPDFRPWSASVQ